MVQDVAGWKAPDVLPLIDGSAVGQIMYSDVALSFWGGVDPNTGVVIDEHHPLLGQAMSGCILAIPRGRGSCTGSGVLVELVLNGNGPAAILVCEEEEILTLGSIVADVVFQKPLPIFKIAPSVFKALQYYRFASVSGDHLRTAQEPIAQAPEAYTSGSQYVGRAVRLSELDAGMLSGEYGQAAEIAMRLLVRMAVIQQAEELIDVSQVHIDGCCYNGPAGLMLAEKFVTWGAKVRVPTTLNSISVDRRHWRELGISRSWGEPADALADAYLAMGAEPTYTCAPYLLDTAPQYGEQIGWAESYASGEGRRLGCLSVKSVWLPIPRE
ncbi:aconitase X (plasmid) [Rhizobium leguminosarum]